MLTSIEIQNFRCFPKANAALKPLTVLIGPNDSGKSAFLTAVRYVVGQSSFQDPADIWGNKSGGHMVITATTPLGEISINHRSGRSGSKKVLDTVTPFALFNLPSTGIGLQCAGAGDGQGPPTLGSSGENLPALLDYLLRTDRPRFDRFVADITERLPGVEGIDIGTPDAGSRSVRLVIEQGWRINASHMSVGVRLMLFFVALRYHPLPPRLLLLEEPENGVHPKRLQDIMQIFHEMTKSDWKPYPVQVILTTHSPYLLDHVNVEEDQVLVFRRLKNGNRVVEPASQDRLKPFLDEFMLGEVWYNKGEEGLVAK